MSQAQKPDILRHELNHTMSSKAFQHLLEVYITSGVSLYESNKCIIPCPNCKSNHLVDLLYGISIRDIKYHHTICLNCWEIAFWLPIYENEPSTST